MDNKYTEVMNLILNAMNEVKSNGNPAATATSSCISVCASGCDGNVPLGISNRHIHLSQSDLDVLFGPGYQMTNIKDLSQPGQYACKETVTIVGPKGAIEKVRVLGPVRKETQVEILAADGFKLGVKGEVRMSGKLDGTQGCTVVGPRGSVQLSKGVIVAQRHIHMLPEDAEAFGVSDGQIVDIKIEGVRGGILSNVAIRATSTSKLELHLDTEEANALGLNSKSVIKIVK